MSKSLPDLTINTNIGQASYEESDLPLLHVRLESENIDTYNVNDPYRDIRSSSLVLTLYMAELDGSAIDSRDVPAAQTRAEILSEDVNTLIESLAYPDGVIDIVLASRDINAETESTPRLIVSTLIYRSRYHIDLDHPYYRLAYTLPLVPAAEFYS